jgi:ParB-like chromosome segregation protein Spo0J
VGRAQGQPYKLEATAKLKPSEDGLLPPLSDEEFAALKADIDQNGMHVPISIDEEYVIVDGHHRWRACQELRIEQVPTRTHSQLDPAEKRDLALALNLNRRNLSQKQKREVIAALVRQDPERTDRRIAESAGVDNKTVARVRAKLEAGEEIPHVTQRQDSRGRKQPASKPSSKGNGAQPRRRRGKRMYPAFPLDEADADLPAGVQKEAEEQGIAMAALSARYVREGLKVDQAKRAASRQQGRPRAASNGRRSKTRSTVKV